MEEPGTSPPLIWLHAAVEGGSAAWRVALLTRDVQQRVDELVDGAAFGQDCDASEIDIDVMCGKEDIRPAVRRGKRAGGTFAVDVRRLSDVDDDAIVADLLWRVADLLVLLAERRGCSQQALQPLLALRHASGIIER